MPKIRVLFADDAVVVRKIITDILAEDPDIEVVGTAPNGKLALAKIPQVNPDIVILDVEMPEMDGLQTVKALRKLYPMLPVIMFSTLTRRGAEATLDALSFGANDYVTKPANVGSVSAAMQTVRETLIPKIKLFCAKVLAGSPGKAPALASSKPASAIGSASAAKAPAPVRVAPPVRLASTGVSSRIDLVAIGCSTGGPDALAKVIPLIPNDFATPIVIVQHMPPMFTRLLAERLDARSQIRVREAESGQVLKPGTAWIAPGDFHLMLEEIDGKIQTRVFVGPPENSCRPAVDVLFRSVAACYGGRALGVVLTGMGQDGLRGSEHLTEAGSQVIAQDEASSVVWGMPGFIAQAGLASRVLPLDEVAGEIIRRGHVGRVAALPPARPTGVWQAVGGRA